MLLRPAVRYLSTRSTSSVVNVPDLKWDHLSTGSKSLINKWTWAPGLATFIGAYALTYNPDYLYEVLRISLVSGGVGSLAGRFLGYLQTPEYDIRDTFQKIRKIETEFDEMKKNSMFAVAQNSNDLAAQIQKINYNQTHPLVEAFESWKKQCDRLAELEKEAHHLSVEHQRLIDQVDPIFRAPLSSNLIKDLESSRQRLMDSMIEIKTIPNWFERVTSYNQEKTKEAAEKAAIDSQRAREAAESAQTMATVSAVASIIRRN
jgi:hypothetical protein